MYCTSKYFTSKSFFFHCVKSVVIWSFSGPYFPAFGLNTESCEVSLLCIQSKCGKMRTRKSPNTDTSHAVHLKHINTNKKTYKAPHNKTSITLCT